MSSAANLFFSSDRLFFLFHGCCVCPSCAIVGFVTCIIIMALVTITVITYYYSLIKMVIVYVGAAVLQSRVLHKYITIP